jgi:hypothetical protein
MKKILLILLFLLFFTVPFLVRGDIETPSFDLNGSFVNPPADDPGLGGNFDVPGFAPNNNNTLLGFGGWTIEEINLIPDLTSPIVNKDNIKIDTTVKSGYLDTPTCVSVALYERVPCGKDSAANCVVDSMDCCTKETPYSLTGETKNLAECSLLLAGPEGLGYYFKTAEEIRLEIQIRDDSGAIITSRDVKVIKPIEADQGGDGVADLHNLDSDGDGIMDDKDNCPSISNVDQKDSDKDGVGNKCDFSGGGPVSSSDLFELIDRIIGIVFWIATTFSFFMIVIGGFLMVTSAGDPQKVGRGRNTVFYAIVGFAVMSLSKGIVALLLALLGVKENGG